jgi:DNA-directed RNA polymerase subunit omega
MVKYCHLMVNFCPYNPYKTRLDKTVCFLYCTGMIFPLEKLIKYDGNMYEITCASSRRAYQLAMLDDPELEENDGKAVSLAARQLFNGEIQFKVETPPREDEGVSGLALGADAGGGEDDALPVAPEM